MGNGESAKQIGNAFRVSLALLLFSVSFATTLPYAHAQSIGFSLDKSIEDLELLPGTSYNEKIRVSNLSKDSALPLVALIDHFDQRDEEGDIDFINVTPELNALSWFRFKDGKELLLAPGESKDLIFTIEPPKTALPGSYFVIMRFSPLLSNALQNSDNTRQVPQIGVLFFIKVSALTLDSSKTSYAATISSVEIVSNSNQVKTLSDLVVPTANAGVIDEQVQKVIVGIVNDGAYHFKSGGFLEIKNWFGKVVTSVNFPEKYLLPGRVRKVEVSTVPLKSEITGFWNKLWNMAYTTFESNSYFGPYTASIHLLVPEKGEINTDVSFWIVPWKFWLPLLIILGAIIWLSIKLRYRLRLAFLTLIGR